MLEEPEVWGVEAARRQRRHASGSWSRPRRPQQYRVSRELRERLKVAFDEEGIEIPFPQQTVWHRSDPRDPVGSS